MTQIMRGGSWFNFEVTAYPVSRRLVDYIVHSDATLGFRIAKHRNRSRMFRGGSWYDVPDDCRSAYRDYDSPVYHYFYMGFRIVRRKI